MKSKKTLNRKAGLSLVEVLITSAILLLIFGGLFAAFSTSLKLVSQSRVKTTALSFSNDRMEYIRSLAYNEVGTVSGIPAGNIPQNRTITLNGIDFNERVLIEYVDDPADGLDILDDNGIVADYKRVKVEYSWEIGELTDSLFLVSNIVPASVETDAGGGSLRVNVFDANVAALSGMSVRLLNQTVTPNIDVTRTTNSNGMALFTGAPAASDYEIFVFATGYSQEQTHQATTSLPNPNTRPVSIIEGGVSTMNFQIDRLSDLNLNLFSDKNINFLKEDFSTTTKLESFNNVVVGSGSLVLASTTGVYETEGSVLTKLFSPSLIKNWGVLKINYATSSATDIKIQFFSSTSTADIISESDLPGNSSGFGRHYVDLQSLPISRYPNLAVGIKLSTEDTSQTPEVNGFYLEFLETVTPLANTAFDIRGNKTIGTLADLSPVFKFSSTTRTDSLGLKTFPDFEWDSYFLDVAGLSIKEICAVDYPMELKPDTDKTANIWLETSTPHSVRVIALDQNKKPIINAPITISRSGFSKTINSGWCGQAFFSGISSASDYEIKVSPLDFPEKTLSGISVNGETEQVVNFSS